MPEEFADKDALSPRARTSAGNSTTTGYSRQGYALRKSFGAQLEPDVLLRGLD